MNWSKPYRMLLLIILLLAMVRTSDEIISARASSGTHAAKSSQTEKWIDLFNGRDMQDWRLVGKGYFKVEDGALVSHGGMGMLEYDGRKFRDFELRVEFKVAAKCANSGVYVRFPEKKDDPWYAVNNGYEIQIDDCDPKGLLFRTGSIYSFSPATRLATKPVGEWNTFDITVVGQHYTVLLNGEKVNDFTGSRGREGYIGLQCHDPFSSVQFRTVRIREISD